MTKGLERQIREAETDLEELHRKLHALERTGHLHSLHPGWDGSVETSEKAERVLEDIQQLGDYLDCLYSQADGA